MNMCLVSKGELVGGDWGGSGRNGERGGLLEGEGGVCGLVAAPVGPFIPLRGGGPDGARGEVAGREAGAEGDDGLRVVGVATGGSWSTEIARLWIGTAGAGHWCGSGEVSGRVGETAAISSMV